MRKLEKALKLRKAKYIKRTGGPGKYKYIYKIAGSKKKKTTDNRLQENEPIEFYADEKAAKKKRDRDAGMDYYRRAARADTEAKEKLSNVKKFKKLGLTTSAAKGLVDHGARMANVKDALETIAAEQDFDIEDIVGSLEASDVIENLPKKKKEGRSAWGIGAKNTEIEFKKLGFSITDAKRLDAAHVDWNTAREAVKKYGSGSKLVANKLIAKVQEKSYKDTLRR